MANGSKHLVFRWNDKIWKLDDGLSESGDDKYFVVVTKLFVQWSKVNSFR